MWRDDTNTLDLELIRLVSKFDEDIAYAERHSSDPILIEDLTTRRQMHHDRLVAGSGASEVDEAVL